MRISDWSSDVCSSDLFTPRCLSQLHPPQGLTMAHGSTQPLITATRWRTTLRRGVILGGVTALHLGSMALLLRPVAPYRSPRAAAHNSEPPLQIHFVILPRQSHRADSPRSEEHTSELQSLM